MSTQRESRYDFAYDTYVVSNADPFLQLNGCWKLLVPPLEVTRISIGIKHGVVAPSTKKSIVNSIASRMSSLNSRGSLLPLPIKLVSVNSQLHLPSNYEKFSSESLNSTGEHLVRSRTLMSFGGNC